MARFNEQLILISVGLAHQVSVDSGGSGAAVASGEYMYYGLTASSPLRPRWDMVNNTEAGADNYGYPASEGVLGVLGVLFLSGGGGGSLWLRHLPESLQERRDLLLLLACNLEAWVRRVGSPPSARRILLLLSIAFRALLNNEAGWGFLSHN